MANVAEHWNFEYGQGSPHLLALSSDQPSKATAKFVDFLKELETPFSGELLEVGCGMGRNTNWLAQIGFGVTGVDISEVAITEAKKRVQELGVTVHYYVADITQPWQVAKGSLDYTLDFATSHLLTTGELKSYKSELIRSLRSRGRFVLYTLDRTKDAQAQKLLQECPGPEPNTYIIPEMKHLERVFSLEDLETLYQPLKVEYSELIFRPTRFKDQVFDRYYWWVVFKKI